MFTILLLSATLSADPSPEQTKLLKTFSEEFISITPGRGKFPKKFVMGRAEGGRDNERPVREVTFTYEFSIAKYEMPQNLWQAVPPCQPNAQAFSRCASQ